MSFFFIFHELCFRERRRNPMERVSFGPGNSTLLWALWTCLWGKIASRFLHLNFLGAFLLGILGVTSAEVAVICPDAVSQDSFPPICCKSGCDFQVFGIIKSPMNCIRVEMVNAILLHLHSHFFVE